MEGRADTFYQDCRLFADLCSVYKGNFWIAEAPQDFVPVNNRKMLQKLVDPETLYILENQATVRIGGVRWYKFILNPGFKYIFQFPSLKPKNLAPDPTNPLKYSFYMV